MYYVCVTDMILNVAMEQYCVFVCDRSDTVCGHGAILCIICVTDMILNVAMEQYYVYVCDRSDTKCGHGTVLWSTEVQGQDTGQQTSEETA